MTALAFDTLKAVKRLKEAGVTEAQAEALVETFGGAFNDHIATKDDLALLKGDLSAKIEAQGKGLRGEIEAQGKGLRGEIEAQGKELRSEIETQGKELRSEIKAQGQELRGEIAFVRKDMEAMEQRMTIKLGSMIVAAVVFLSVLERLIPVAGGG